MSVGITARSVKVFDGTNFLGWKAQVNALFLMNDVLDVVDGTRTAPAVAEGHEVEAKKFIKDDATAKYIVLSNLDESQQVNVLTCETAREMWNKLTLIHEQKTETNKIGLLQRFHAYRMGESDTAVQHVSKVLNMARQLKDVGEPQSDATVIAKILASLAGRFSTLQIAWDSVDPARQTLEHLQERLIREDSRLEADTDAASALVATRKDREKKKPRKPKKEIECYRCHEMGHFARECKSERRKKDGDGKTRDCVLVVESNATMRTTRARGSREDAACEQVRELLSVKQSETWLIDSGASRHLTYRREWLTDFRENRDGATISLGDNKECKVVGEGTVPVKKLVDGVWRDARIEKVLFVPELRKNLFSVGVCMSNGYEVRFRGNRVEVTDDDEVIASGVMQGNGICRMLLKVVKPGSAEEANVAATNLTVWHERLGHVGKRAICELVKKGLVTGVKLTDKSDVFCEPCQLGKAHRQPFNENSVKVATVPGEMVHTDVCGPMTEKSPGGSRYVLTFKDDASGYRHAYFLKEKSEVFGKFKQYERMVANKFGRAIRRVRSDNGSEFRNLAMDEYFELRGIVRETTAPHTPEQNGRAERDNRTIIESARTMLLAKGLPRYLWAEAVNCAVYVLNRTAWGVDAPTPYEMWVGKAPNLKHLRIFGSEAFVHIPKQFTKKFDARAKKLIFVGYKDNSANYRLFDPRTRRVEEARNVVFRESIGSTAADSSRDEDDEEEIILPAEEEDERDDEEDDVEEVEVDENEVEEAAPRHVAAERAARAAPAEGGAARAPETPRQLRDRASIRTPRRYAADIAEYAIPNTYKEAIDSTEAAQWADAIKDELRAHDENHTWKLVPRTADMRTIDSKWVFRVKTSAEGENHRFKARLCARGFLQREGIDYNETFAPVVRYDSLRVLLATIATKDLEVVQFDVQTAFLYGKLDETVFMEVPDGVDLGARTSGSVVCQLERSLYGLKQSPRCWNRRFTEFLSEFEFKECEADKCVFVGEFEGEIVYLALFVDDGLIASRKKETLNRIVSRLSQTFKVTIGDSSVFVGMQIIRDRERKSVIIHQSAYTAKIIEKFRMSEARALCVPADPNVILSPFESEDRESSSVPYREAVGSLVFLASVSRPDIAFAVNSVSRFLSKHNAEHWRAVKRIFAYLGGTVDYGIEYRDGGSEPELIGFSDADYAGDIETRRSTTGYVFCLANGAITWSSQRQKLVTLSTTEAEYVAASAATRESIWLRKLLFGIGCPCVKETTLFVDNQSAIQLVKNPVFHKRTKHIDIHYHFVRERVDMGDVLVKYVPSEKQRADIFTKALPRDRFKSLCESLNMVRAKH